MNISSDIEVSSYLVNKNIIDMKTKILVGGGIIDFYVDKKKFNGCKSKNALFNYIQSCLTKHLESMVGMTFNNIELRDITIISNHFWGQDNITTINDIGYSCNNELPLNEEVVTVRIFQIDVIGVVINANEHKPVDMFFNHKTDDFLFSMSNGKIV